MSNLFGFYRVASAITIIKLGDTEYNSQEIIKQIKEADSKNISIILFSELIITGYSIGDLITTKNLFDKQNIAIEKIIKETNKLNIISIIGIYINYLDRLYNCALIIQKGSILGIVPKTYLINKKEFYEKRYFNSGEKIKNINISFFNFNNIPFGVDILFTDNKNLCFGVEICEDLWAINPPSNKLSSSGANLIFNLSASNETVTKSEIRRDLIKVQSYKCLIGYIYSSSGVGESSTDTIFSGDALIYENGKLILENRKFNLESHLIFADLDLEMIKYLRVKEGTFSDSKIYNFRKIFIQHLKSLRKIDRKIDKYPFLVLENKKDIFYQNIINIQAQSIIKRLSHIKSKKVIIGVSGGLDSSLALLSLHNAFKIMHWDFKNIISITMPSFGTTTKTKDMAIELAEKLKVSIRKININKIVNEEFKAINHNSTNYNVVFENVQARVRTSILMNVANQENGVVIGTGNLSEIALGWNTFNGDHISMYSLNCGIPKTLIIDLIKFYQKDNSVKDIIQNILETPISPELLPHKNNKISQETENIIGPYELHDFFLYHFLTYGATKEKILFLVNYAFEDKYKIEIINKWLNLFFQRFYSQQFKRNCTPDGPKILDISLNPRTDWKMPSDFNIDFDKLDFLENSNNKH